MSWKEKLGFMASKGMKLPVGEGGEELVFYPLSTRVLFRLKGLTGPIGKALSVLFTDKENDTGQIHKNFEDESGTRGTESKLLPITPELAEFRSQERQEAITLLMDSITDDANKLILGLIITDSLRDVFDRKMKEDEICEIFEEEGIFGLDNVVALLVNVAKANKKVFGSLGDKVSTAMSQALETAVNNATDQVAAKKEEIANDEADQDSTE